MPNALTLDPQAVAADPYAHVFVGANAGSGKTTTLVARVARLLLSGAAPETILCVTYTKAAASEMQRRLFERLGSWSVKPNDVLATELEALHAGHVPPERARVLFAQALETPGGLKIQTIHAFCEKLLRRFPVEAVVSPGFRVLEDPARLRGLAREAMAAGLLQDPGGPASLAHRRLARELNAEAFDKLLLALENPARLEAWVEALAPYGGAAGIFKASGLADAREPDAYYAEFFAQVSAAAWAGLAEALAAPGVNKTDVERAEQVRAVIASQGAADALQALFLTQSGTLRAAKTICTSKIPEPVKAQLLELQDRFVQSHEAALAARAAHLAQAALILGLKMSQAYAAEKQKRGALDFSDLIAKVESLLVTKAEAAFVLYKLDNGLEHMLLDEAQDTSPEQWRIFSRLTESFFDGEDQSEGRRRTVFAVGDKKQSIYSFQGAAPEQFTAQRQLFATRAANVGLELATPDLLVNYRSSPVILDFVDRVFGLDGAGVAEADEPVRHEPKRRSPGVIELWPFEVDDRAPPQDAEAPLDAQSPFSARQRVAANIVAAIQSMLARGEAVETGAADAPDLRPLTPGDVLILVRKRDALFEEILRALDNAGLPTAGADQLQLSQHPAFMDLIGLIRFCRFSGDDLQLAAILRGPLFDISETELFMLCFGHPPGTLYLRLRERMQADPVWAERLGLLEFALGASRRATPFDFLARILSRKDAQGRTQRQRLVTRLGPEAGEALDEILGFALNAEADGDSDLERFLHRCARAEVKIKRELEGAHGQIRVMTVHAAKGLEAPVVILPDIFARPAKLSEAVLVGADGLNWIGGPKRRDGPQAAEARVHRLRQAELERRRLLYVALTRARDRLILCGALHAGSKAEPPGCWGVSLKAAFDQLEAEGLAVWDGSIRRVGAPIFAPPSPPAAASVRAAPPAWLTALPEKEPRPQFVAASGFEDAPEDQAAPSPLAGLGKAPRLSRLSRGSLIHSLLQILPDLPPAERRAAAQRRLEQQPELTPDARAEILKAVFGVLEDARFAEVFAPGSRAEVALSGPLPELGPGVRLAGRVDRLALWPDRVLVVDFKSHRPAPETPADIDPAHLAQMGAYVSVLRQLYPDRRVEAALLFTDGPRFYALEADVLTAALTPPGAA